LILVFEILVTRHVEAEPEKKIVFDAHKEHRGGGNQN